MRYEITGHDDVEVQVRDTGKHTSHLLASLRHRLQHHGHHPHDHRELPTKPAHHRHPAQAPLVAGCTGR